MSKHRDLPRDPYYEALRRVRLPYQIGLKSDLRKILGQIEPESRVRGKAKVSVTNKEIKLYQTGLKTLLKRFNQLQKESKRLSDPRYPQLQNLVKELSDLCTNDKNAIFYMKISRGASNSSLTKVIVDCILAGEFVYNNLEADAWLIARRIEHLFVTELDKKIPQKSVDILQRSIVNVLKKSKISK